MSIESAIYSALTASTAATSVYGLTTGRIWHIEGQQDETLPQLVFSIADKNQESTFKSTHTICTVEFLSLGDGAAGVTAVQAIDSALFTQMNHKTATATGYDYLAFTRESAGVVDIEDNAAVCRSTYTVRAVNSGA